MEELVLTLRARLGSDGNIRYYEYENDEMFFLSSYQSPEPQRGMAFLPKRAVNVSECEVVRAYKVTSSLVEPISFKVPRKVSLAHAVLRLFPLDWRFVSSLMLSNPISSHLPLETSLLWLLTNGSVAKMLTPRPLISSLDSPSRPSKSLSPLLPLNRLVPLNQPHPLPPNPVLARSLTK